MQRSLHQVASFLGPPGMPGMEITVLSPSRAFHPVQELDTHMQAQGTINPTEFLFTHPRCWVPAAPCVKDPKAPGKHRHWSQRGCRAARMQPWSSPLPGSPVSASRYRERQTQMYQNATI